MSIFAKARSSLTDVLQDRYDEFKVIWKVFCPHLNIGDRDVHGFLDLLNVYAKDYFTFVKILMIYRDKFPIPDQTLEDMYGHAVQWLGLQEVPMFNYDSMRVLHANEIQTVHAAFAFKEQQKLAYIRKILGLEDNQVVPLEDFNRLQNRVRMLEEQIQRLLEKS